MNTMVLVIGIVIVIALIVMVINTNNEQSGTSIGEDLEKRGRIKYDDTYDYDDDDFDGASSFRLFRSLIRAFNPKRDKNRKVKAGGMNNPNYYEGLSMGELLDTIVKNIGGQIESNDMETDRFYVTYQGEHFTILYSDECLLIQIYDVAWYSAEANDIENLSLVRQAVNACNKDNSSTVLYTIEKEENRVNVHTRQCIVFGSFLPDVEGYLRSRFEDSFRQHHNFYRIMEGIRQEQYAK